MAGRVELYDQAGRAAIARASARRLVQFWLMTAALAAGAIVLFALRQQAATIALTIVGGGLIIFWWDWKARRAVRHARKLRAVGKGLRHEVSLVIREIEEDSFLRDGLEYRRLVCADEDGAERYLYWDAALPLRGLDPGIRARIEHAGNDILAYEVLP